jgi:hypothetical protein
MLLDAARNPYIWPDGIELPRPREGWEMIVGFVIGILFMLVMVTYFLPGLFGV